VQSAVDHGSVFRVYLPVAVAHTPAKRVARPPVTGKTILVVDDEEIVLSVSQHCLERVGHTVLTATGGRQAIDLFRQHHEEIGLVILDLTMPRMSGEETFRELKEIREDVRVVISSGYTRADAASRFDAASIEEFLQKPYRPHELMSLVDRIFERPDTSESRQTANFQI
jgi:DNA-binding NtrC family response regulator